MLPVNALRSWSYVTTNCSLSKREEGCEWADNVVVVVVRLEYSDREGRPLINDMRVTVCQARSDRYSGWGIYKVSGLRR